MGKKVSVYPPCPPLTASLTVEAAFSLSIFVFAMVCLLLPMKIMNTHRQMQTALEMICEKASQYAYIKGQIERGRDGRLDSQVIARSGSGWAGEGGDAGVHTDGERTVEGSEIAAADSGWGAEYGRMFLEGALEAYAASELMRHGDSHAVSQLTLRRSRILEDGFELELTADYQVKLPFPILRLSSVSQSVRSCRRAWAGKEGGRGDGHGHGEDGDDEIVYVGKGSTRYHNDRNCHYLSNRLTSVLYDQLEDYRSEDGSRYQPCAACGSKAGSGQTVYIMQSGRRFHADPECGAIAAYVRAVPKKEVEHLGPCSYCSQ